MIRARVRERFGEFEHADASSPESRLESAAEGMRNLLVPLQTIAKLLEGELDGAAQAWCASILRDEIEHVRRILDDVS